MDEATQPASEPASGPPADSLQAAEAALAMALHAMAQAAGLAMMAIPNAQACARQVGNAAVTRVCQGLLDIDFKTSRQG